jgi:hypothetical protein
MCFSPVDEVEIDPFSRPVIRFAPMHFLCSAGKTGPAECRESCKDLATHCLIAYDRGTHVTGRDVGPGSYEGAEVFHLQFLCFYSGL